MTIHRYAVEEKDALDDARVAFGRYRRNVRGSVLTAVAGLLSWPLTAILMSLGLLDPDYGWLIAIPGLALIVTGGAVALNLLVAAHERKGCHPADTVRLAGRAYDRAVQAEIDDTIGDAP